MTTQLTLSVCLSKEEQRDATLIALGYPGYEPKTDHGRQMKAQYTATKQPTLARPLKPANASINND
ncbi:hypothetical protein [Rufibacter quisquiliarum]|uniref:Uncharacterized protein n=1 Tax=Rufibacter quisquiliarum TaxID=1549639 RepID=A0A839GKJ6_9BACT|nr:hypothetical protein [Rufibacter quisquiliarum]MBA9078303.1 hypothetical protein [Rufibacter quisquiliarum]